MKSPTFRPLAALLPVLLLFPLYTRALDTGISYAVFATGGKPYVEVNIEIAAASVTYKRVDSTHLQAAVEIMILIKNGEAVANYEKYVLNSPLVGSPQSLLDVKRFMVPNGDYQLEVHCTDINDLTNTDQFSAPVKVNVSDALYLSEILLLRDFRPDEHEGLFNKNGFYIEPLPFNFYDRAALTLAFYAEIYNTHTAFPNSTYNLRFIVEKELGNDKKEQITAANLRKRPAPMDVIIAPIDITNLPSGNYSLTVEVRNSVNELLITRNVQFQRSNPFLKIDEDQLTEEVMARQFVQNLDETELRYALRAISPLMDGDESEILKNVLRPESDLKSMRFVLFRHYIRKDPNNPEMAYQQYMKVARAVDDKFHSGFRHGFETDRGRIFLRYGTPDDLVHVEDDPSAPPYEIWIYYNFPKTNQKNVKFLFYNPSLAGDDFVTLHSTARGEINNPRWEIDLYKRNAGEQYEGDNYHDATQMKSNVGRYARSYFTDY